MMPVDFMGFIPMLILALLVVSVAGRALESNVSGAEQMQNDGLIIKAEDDDMKIAFVLDICNRRDHMLTKWVQEIFDKDGDGYISHFEREIDR
ncbi:hypothetical protein MAR_024536 [Mya arenaria]|uniref:EF-hand domain-containing protein n=1 Tax=Mya arenaria TaxID=6604 RepID=A0ABY7DTF6_MYAAR|nr:hypothetical protein MAR_024536 [Mya arenaria]